MPAPVAQPPTTPIPVQLSASECTTFRFILHGAGSNTVAPKGEDRLGSSGHTSQPGAALSAIIRKRFGAT